MEVERPLPPPTPPSPAAEGEVSVTEAAYQLGCSTWIIYYWIDTGKLAARRDPGGRLHISWNEQIEAECRGRIEQSGTLIPRPVKLSPVSGPEPSANVSASCHRDDISANGPWPAPIAKHKIQTQTRLREGQHEITVRTVRSVTRKSAVISEALSPCVNRHAAASRIRHATAARRAYTRHVTHTTCSRHTTAPPGVTVSGLRALRVKAG